MQSKCIENVTQIAQIAFTQNEYIEINVEMTKFILNGYSRVIKEQKLFVFHKMKVMQGIF